jgi:group I intron endonuclease
MYSLQDCYKTPKDSDLCKFGVYCIENINSGKQYIGSTSGSFSKRFREHFNALKNNKHHSQILQRSFNKHGIESFSLKILEEVDTKDYKILRAREQYYLDTLKPEYNILPNAESFSGYKYSEERKKKQVNVLRSKFAAKDCGVKYHPTDGKWSVHISVTDFKMSNLGYFKTKEEALTARKQAEVVFWTEEFDNLPTEEKKIIAKKYKKSIVRADCTSGYRYISISSARIGGKCWKFFYKRKLIQSFYTLEEAVDFRDKYLEENNLI